MAIDEEEALESLPEVEAIHKKLGMGTILVCLTHIMFEKGYHETGDALVNVQEDYELECDEIEDEDAAIKRARGDDDDEDEEEVPDED